MRGGKCDDCRKIFRLSFSNLSSIFASIFFLPLLLCLTAAHYVWISSQKSTQKPSETQ